MLVTDPVVQSALASIPQRFRGPGGAVAVVKDGELVGRHVWGYANIDERIPMTPDTQMPICSITKQMLCALLIDLERNPTPTMAIKGDVREQLSTKLNELLCPEMVQKGGLTIDHLCDNQSGIRDYWAITTLWGARPESSFSLAQDGEMMRQQLSSFQFQPGTEYSYANTNFHVLGRIVEGVSNESIGTLLAQRVFAPAGMAAARFCPDTSQCISSCVGYEGDEKHGYVPALNKIEWSGDAGVMASLPDMVAYERHLYHCLSNPQSWYQKVLESSYYSDGIPARYRHGLVRIDIDGIATVGHGGALRGFRLHRLQAPTKRLSVVVMLNHEADAAEAAEDILRDILGLKSREFVVHEPSISWYGTFLDQNTQLMVTVSPSRNRGELLIEYAGYPETIRLADPNHGESRDMIASIEDDWLRIQRLEDNRMIHARRLVPEISTGDISFIQGTYHCAEINSFFHCRDEGGLLYGAFDGFLGKGPARLMRCPGENVWAIACPRGLDAPAPGDWTVVFNRDIHGAVCGATIGCWLARKLEFVRQP